MSRWLVVVNRAAGRRPVSPSVVASALDAYSVSYDMAVPATRRDSIELMAAEASSGRTHFAVVGGDGSVNTAANALLGAPLDFKPVVAVLPAGTGCDLIRTFGIPQDLRGAARHLATPDTYEIDVVAVEGAWGRSHFVNVAQAGVGAAAVQTAHRMGRRLGSGRYPAAFGARLIRFPRARVRVTTERREYEADALAVIVANAQFFAGGWNIAPRATLIDGVVDIQVISSPKHRAPALVPKLITGNHLRDPTVRRFSAAEFRIESEPVWPFEADGDPVGNTAVSGRVVPAALHLKI